MDEDDMYVRLKEIIFHKTILVRPKGGGPLRNISQLEGVNGILLHQGIKVGNTVYPYSGIAKYVIDEDVLPEMPEDGPQKSEELTDAPSATPRKKGRRGPNRSDQG